MKLKYASKRVKPYLFKKVVKEVPTEFEGNKAKWRYQIQEEVFDSYDSIADNAKMISLLFSVIVRIWDALPDDIKSNISDTDKSVIDYAVTKFKNTQTRADTEFSEQGNNFIDKLMDRQGKINTIINGE